MLVADLNPDHVACLLLYEFIGVTHAHVAAQFGSPGSSLGPTERAHLLERLIDSFEPEGKVRDAWIAKAHRRHEVIKSGKVAEVPGAEVVVRFRARIS